MRIRSKRTTFAIFGSVLLAPLLSQIADAQGTTGQAGVAAAVRGNVTLVAAIAPQPERVVGQALGSGDKIFLGDNIETGPNSGMQIMLLDETIFTIGPSAGMVIDTFVYDPRDQHRPGYRFHRERCLPFRLRAGGQGSAAKHERAHAAGHHRDSRHLGCGTC